MTPTIISVEQTSVNVQFAEGVSNDWNEVRAAGRDALRGHGEWSFDVGILCPNNSEVTLNVNVVVEDGELYDIGENIFSLDEHTVDDGSGLEPNPDDLDEFEKEIQEAIDDYDGGLEFKAREQAMRVMQSGNGPCKEGI